MYGHMTLAELNIEHRNNESAYASGDRDMGSYLERRRWIREAQQAIVCPARPTQAKRDLAAIEAEDAEPEMTQAEGDALIWDMMLAEEQAAQDA